MALTRHRPRLQAVPLFWRVFGTNAAVLAVATAVLALSPATVSFPVALTEAAILAFGIVVMLVVNLVLLRRTLSPLQRLTRLMRDVDPLRPGGRVPAGGGDPEVLALAEAFNDMLDRLETERRDSGLRALAAQEAERRRIARELHDEIGQSLTGVVLQLERTVRLLPTSELRDEVEQVRETARESLDDLRRIAREVRPEVLDDLGLPSALIALASGLAKRSGLAIERRVGTSLPALSPEVELVLYRVAQESLTNVARHAEASRAELVLERAGDGVVLRVRDDGKGFQPGNLESVNGIRGMRERALLIGARLAIDSAPGRGTEVELQVPDTQLSS
jgi:two-component system sensor histidine kinase UhpB